MPDNSDDHYKRGLIFFQNNQFNDAIVEFQKAIKIMSDHSGSYLHLGLSYKQKGQFKEAIQELQKYLKLIPKDIECRKDLVFLYLDLEEYKNAINEFNKVMKVDKSDFEFLSQFGSKLSRSDDEMYFDTAKMCLELANKINPNDVKLRIRLLKFYLNICELSKDDQKKYWKELFELDPSDVKIILVLAEQYAFFDNDQIERKCISALKENLEKNPDKIQACADFTLAMLAAYCVGGNKHKHLLNETILIIPEILDQLPKSDNKMLIQAYTDLAFTYGHLDQTDNVIITWEKLLNFVSSTKLLPWDLFGDLESRLEGQKKYGKLVRFYNWVLHSDINEMDPMFKQNEEINRYYLELSKNYFKLKKYYFAKDALEKITDESRYSTKVHEELDKINQKIEKIETLERKIDRFERELRLLIEIRCIKNKKDFLEDNIDEYLTNDVKKLLRRDLDEFPKSSKEDFNQYDYLTLTGCQTIIGSYWEIFSPVFKQKKSFNERIIRIIKFRNAVKHNRPIEKSIIGDCQGSVDWILNVMGKIDNTN